MNVKTVVELNRAQENSEHDSFTVARYLSFLSHFDPGTRDVLDLGCNTGRGGEAMKSRLPHLRITGVDCVPERLRAIDRNAYDAAVCSFSHDISLPDSSFDAIVGAEFIEHVPSVEVFPSLCECWRLLRLKGCLLLTTPNPGYLKNRVRGLSVLLEPSHLSQHTTASMRRGLEDVGFSRVKIYGSGRVSRFIGSHFPFRSVYGSYLVVARKW